jgi:hypothetical protein
VKQKDKFDVTLIFSGKTIGSNSGCKSDRRSKPLRVGTNPSFCSKNLSENRRRWQLMKKNERWDLDGWIKEDGATSYINRTLARGLLFGPNVLPQQIIKRQK